MLYLPNSAEIATGSSEQKRHGILSVDIVLIYDTAHPHSIHHTTQFLQGFDHCLTIHHTVRISFPAITIFIYTSTNLFLSVLSQWQSSADVCHTLIRIPEGKLLQHSNASVDPTVWHVFQLCDECVESRSTIPAYVPINIFI